MYPIIFTFGKLNVYSHGLLMAIGGIAGGLVILYLAKKEHLKTNIILDLCVYALLAGLVGSRILYVILYSSEFTSFKDAFYIWNGGLVSYGGIAGGLLIAWLFLKNKKEPVLKWFDLGVIGLMVGWAFGRIGCFLNGDSFGIFNFSKIAIWSRLPTQLFESAWCLVVAFVLYYFGLKFIKAKKLPDGIIFLSGLALYSIGRFVVDFWRDEPITIWFMKTGQFGSLIVLIFMIFAITFLINKERRRHGSL